MEKTCPRCEKLVEGADKTCDACGLVFPPPPPINCAGCGRTVHPESDLCSYCGLEFRAPRIRSDSSAPAATFTLSLSTIIWPIIGLILIGAYLKNRDALNPLTSSLQSAPASVSRKAQAADDYSTQSESRRAPVGHLLPTDVPEEGGFSMEGDLFNILTGEAVAEATIVFHNPDTNDYYGARTDDRGHYYAYLGSVSAGYIVSIQAEGYRSVYVADWTPSIRELDKNTRRFIVADLLGSQPQPEHIFGLPDGLLKKSFTIIPK